MSSRCWTQREMWWGRLFLFLRLWPVLGCEAGRRGACSSWLSRCVNLRCLLSCRSLLEQLRKLQALVRQSTTKTAAAKTCTMVSGFSPGVCEGVCAVLLGLGERCLLRLVMPVHVLC